MTDLATAIPIAAPAAMLPKVQLDQHGRLAEEIICRKCGYNLRGLSLDGRCPECGTAVGRSLSGDFLRFADPDWVGTLASGMNWIVAGIATAIITGIAGALLAGPAGAAGFLLVQFIQIATSVVSLVGYWKVTTPDPAGLGEQPGLTARKLVRITRVTALVLIPVVFFAQTLSPLATNIFTSVAGLVGIVGVFAAFVYARRLALRIPDDKLAANCRTVMWGLAAVMFAGLFFAIAAPVATAAGAICIVALPGLFFALWSLRLIDHFRKAFKEAARMAWLTWAADLSSKE